MHYGIVAIGSRGDVQPYVALALGLQKRGHMPTIMAHENFREFVEDFGIRFAPVKGHVEQMLQSPEGMQMLKNGSLAAFTKYLQKVSAVTSESIGGGLIPEFEKVDVLVASLLAMPWLDGVAEKLGKKWAIVQLNLPAIKTGAFPMVILDLFNFPAYNRFTYRLFERIYWIANKKNVNAFRRQLGLTPLTQSILKKIADEKIPNLHCFSPSLLARPNDWPPEADITGFLFLPNEEREKRKQNDIPVELLRWMEDTQREQGSRSGPIYIGFGSIPIPDPEKFQNMLTELINTTTYRFIFCQGWSKPMDLPNHPRLFQIKSVSHEWLLPRCRAAIIHGGVGTTAAALRSKIPLIIISIIADQPWWGKIIETKGVGVHIPFKKVTTLKLLAAIEKTETPEMQNSVTLLGDQINQEGGLKKTIDVLEKYFARNVKSG